MTSILGISGFYHDSAAALVVDGKIIAAAQEERFSRRKQDESFPAQAIQYCLNEAQLTAAEIDYVGFYEKPLVKFDRLLQTYLSYAPVGFRSFAKAMPTWLKHKLHLRHVIRKGLGGKLKRRIVFTGHHESHAASAFLPSPFEDAAILTLDGVGEWTTASFGVGEGRKIRLSHQLRFPHSLGMLYSAFTYHCGFKVNSGEYKLMGLAPFGEPKYADLIRSKLLDIREDGSFRMDMSYFNYCQGLTMTSRKFETLFGEKRRQPESELTQHHMDMAASVQRITEEILLKMGGHIHRTTGKRNLCLAGGVALNCVANGRLLREGPFENLWIQPAAGDAGGALGVALFIWHQLLDNPRSVEPGDSQRGTLLGPQVSGEEASQFFSSVGAVVSQAKNESNLVKQVAGHIANGKVVGWMQGRMEFGPRALGNRSILGDPRNAEMQSKMNLKIKFRESFRPFAPSVLRSAASDYFEIAPEHASPYMLLVANVQPSKLVEDTTPATGLDRLKQIRSVIPAITHVDNSARLQTVDPQRFPRYARLIAEFKRQTGCPMLINTSFNVRGEPIVCTVQEAYRCFMSTNIDVLVVDDCILLKQEQPDANNIAPDAYPPSFELD